MSSIIESSQIRKSKSQVTRPIPSSKKMFVRENKSFFGDLHNNRKRWRSYS